ncbi:MAG: hypothetical protein MUP09_03705 [Thiovulaceae bacterium]|nr:hypothetical protein [Sulfurimonadaceae bacterium]
MVDSRKMERQLKIKSSALLRKTVKEQIKKKVEAQKRERESARKEFLAEVELMSSLYKLHSGS